MTTKIQNDIPPCQIYIDKDGAWYHNGAEMIHREFIRLFYENMELDSEGRYLINMSGKRCYLEVEDTAFVIRSVTRKEAGAGRKDCFMLHLSDETQEKLSPGTLCVGRGNVLYCKVKNGAFPARFNRAAYYQLAQQIEEENGAFYLPLNDMKYPIQSRGDA